jgi:hypothetical protein
MGEIADLPNLTSPDTGSNQAALLIGRKRKSVKFPVDCREQASF